MRNRRDPVNVFNFFFANRFRSGRRLAADYINIIMCFKFSLCFASPLYGWRIWRRSLLWNLLNDVMSWFSRRLKVSSARPLSVGKFLMKLLRFCFLLISVCWCERTCLWKPVCVAYCSIFGVTRWSVHAMSDLISLCFGQVEGERWSDWYEFGTVM